METETLIDSFPLSPMQEGMLFHSLLAARPGVDIEQVLCTLSEDIRPQLFERAWQQVVARHGVLRTSIRWHDATQPRQEVHSHATLRLHLEDWHATPETEHAARLDEWLRADRARGFQLSHAPLMRVALLRTGPARHELVWTFHHLLLDARSFEIVLNEVFTIYEALCRGQELQLPVPPPYRAFVEWQSGLELAASESFWRTDLKGFAAATPLTVARAGYGSEAEAGYGEQELRLTKPVTSALKSLARTSDATLNTVVQGAWALLLSRYSGEDDVAFGVVRAGRRGHLAGADAMVGLFINTVPVRVRIEPQWRLRRWLGSMRNRWLALRPHEHTPLVRIHGWSEVPCGRPIFDSLFNYQDPSWDAALRAKGGRWAKRDFRIRSQSNYPLALDAYGGDALVIRILYHRARFDDAAIARMVGHLKSLLEGMATHPAWHLAQLPLLTPEERQQVLVEWNDTAAEYPADQTVHALFTAQAERTPGALAVADARQQLSYRELEQHADRLTEHLLALGAGPETRIGVCMERSVEMVASKLAIWKAGGAYVPLDPSYPTERRRFIVDDAAMPVVVTQASLRSLFQFPGSKMKVLCVDALPEKCGPIPPGRQPAAAGPAGRRLAYVIYTSGSTGTPKGVELEQASLLNLITWHQRTYGVAPADRAIQMANPAFDASVWELWPYLTAGASVHIPDNETRLSTQKLLAWLVSNRITLAFIPTPIVEALLDEPWPEGGVLRALLTGGDKLHRAPPENFPCPLYNHYGPTENTVVTTWTEVPAARPSAFVPPIGRPISNTHVYVLDRHMQPVPIGVPGELFIGGAGLARGYFNRPDLTAEQFSPTRLAKRACERLYKSGDLVRWREDGQLEFLGRIDHQVKVRGHRIELGEIEALLAQHPAVREAVVTVQTDTKGQKCLAAYLVPSDARSTSVGELRDFLKQKLPDYMVPAFIRSLPALPLTPHGKLDRAALPNADFDARADTAFLAPRTPTENALAGIWSEVLGLKSIGVDDNFFELRGHSLLATQIISRLRSTFGLELPLQALFERPTIAGLAEKIENAIAGGKETPVACPAAAPGPAKNGAVRRHGVLPLSFAQERLWFLEQLEPGVPFSNVPLLLQIDGILHVAALDQALHRLVQRHEVFRTVFKNEKGHPVAFVKPPPSRLLTVFDLTALPRLERMTVARRFVDGEARRPFDLTLGPLLRAKLVRMAVDQHWLLLATHHIACDGWSTDVFCRELSALYHAHAHPGSAPLPELPIAYCHFVQWQRQRMQNGQFDEQLAYWKEHLAGARMALELPTDRPRPLRQTYRGAVRPLALPPKLLHDLERLSRQEGVTLFMLLLAAWQTLLHRYSGESDILIGSPVAGRTHVDTEKLIGMFLNTLVFRGDLSGDPTFTELLHRTRQVALAAYAHQDLPFEKVVDAVQPSRDLGRSPLFQVLFVLQNESLRPLELAGAKLTPLPLHSSTAKFDLTISLQTSSEGLNGTVEYNTDLFDEPTIGRMLGHFQTMLEAVVAHPSLRLSQLPLLTDAERRQMLGEWNDTRARVPEKCVHQFFEEQVERAPNAVAVVFGDQQLTYRELNERAHRLADELRALGVGPGVPVGLCVQRSLEMLAGLLGILKAGGCYVPLDPTYPEPRLAFMLKDSQASALVIQERLQHRFKFQLPGVKLLCLDAPRFTSPTVAHPAVPTHAAGPPRPDNLAYVLYTSGSTGQPKGVMVTHRNVANFFAGMDRVLGSEPGVWLAVTSISFDISVLELFWTLARGFKVVIQPDDYAILAGRNGDETFGQGRSVPEQIVRHGITHMQCTPSLAGALVLAPASLEAMRRLNMLLLGGEALPVSLAKSLREILSGRLLNMYGPTETTVWSTTHRVTEATGPISIGRPIVNTEIYVLDRHLQPVPVGVTGELFIGGAGVARGYLGRPELTREKFIPHPFRSERTACLYRTGDLARYRNDGTLDFLGRGDHQVKIRGHRIEMGEIEAALLRHPSVREAVVVARTDSPGGPRLFAYLSATTEPAPGTRELRQALQSQLPDYMVPSAFVWLTSLPLTPNGKIDRRALPEPNEASVRPKKSSAPPRTKIERAIAEVWQEMLGLEQVGRHDNFFDLGGHSLLVVQTQARLREALGVELPVVRLFQSATISALAAFLEQPQEARSLKKVHDRGRKQREAFGRGHQEELPA